ncbi:glycerol-3-phosphate dehydrogenase [Barrientosiimonas humi]|uniref:Glycerol-3-phosphate dehydrogenase n=1 Tax=Barrientosiimonas humi TaxID=999931 RepID=A0A542XD87_9MICO|nr:glycerol-3-phosphate dehydrogenase/oxidase [Barrientosiimonas humi]TQL33787.1 glycerol-3-phosphate dehydrogenase [Barrientosiimonas humi]CAG7573775.1 Glycerol-3-phosphate dehydrogenase 1 [Barrientosiimonas humi]
MSAPSPAGGRGSLNRTQRRGALERAAERTYDVVVVGGGVTGCGVALDAASRGLSVLLVEQHDLAAGTSRWSSKLVHGGLRYLASGHVGVAHESARERHLLMSRIAPHLVAPMPTLVPLGRDVGRRQGALIRLGVTAGDVLRRSARTPSSLLPRPRRIGAAATLRLAPGLAADGLRGGVLSHDGRLEDDARLVVTLARTAAAAGADVVTRARVDELDAERVMLTDTLTGERLTVRARTVVNSTGAWADRHDDRITVLPSRGSHLVLPAAAVGSPRAALTVPLPGSTSRFLLVLPRPDDQVLVGLTDEPAPGVDPLEPPVPEADEQLLLEGVSRALRSPVTSADVVGRFAGLRPLVVRDDKPSADVSREHLLLDEPGRPLTIAGGKLTTYRRMAQDTVDAVVRRLGRGGECRTATLPLLGAAEAADLAHVAAPARLVRRFGTLAPEVAALSARHPWLADPIAPGSATTGAELAYGVLEEGALTVDDLLARRTRTTFDPAAAAAAVPVAERVLATFDTEVTAATPGRPTPGAR